MPKLTEAARSARGQDLVEAAWRYIARKGYRDLTVDDVCAEAGVSKGAFYGYFTRKRGLLAALLEQDAATLATVLAGAGGPAGEQLRRFAWAMLERAADPARVQLRADLWAAAPTEPEVRERLAATVAAQRGRLRAIIEAGIAAGELAPVPANALTSLQRALDVLLEGVEVRRL